MNHNEAVSLIGDCPCLCHRGERSECWCRAGHGDPIELSHNDRVRVFGHCDCRGRACARTRTSAEMRRLVDAHLDKAREERIRRGRPTSSDLSHIAKNPHRYPQYFGR